MSGRSNAARHGLNGTLPPIHSPPSPLVYGLGQLPAAHHRHPVIIDGMRDGRPPFNGGFRESRPLPQVRIEERLADQYHEIQGLLLDNQGLAATHVALKQELAAVHHELQRVSHAAGSMQAERHAEFREVSYSPSPDTYPRHGEGLSRIAAGSDKLGNALIYRDAIEHEKKGYADNYEQGQLIEKKLILMAREVEKLRPEVANAEKRARAAAAAGNQGTCVTFFLQLTDQSSKLLF
ncbi:hypothetical protein IEQ34_012108 [Dendrobium chrysotoxum]|uniref:Uncharacterized protein n=1 Tax=Dendrobium chrysotoxum TaxID=161865 RepID=A0AAV7GU63_DENCH|nr:hypothetical protein IEQ34_012108 [Dendrobium chrysotoxum]